MISFICKHWYEKLISDKLFWKITIGDPAHLHWQFEGRWKPRGEQAWQAPEGVPFLYILFVVQFVCVLGWRFRGQKERFEVWYFSKDALYHIDVYNVTSFWNNA